MDFELPYLSIRSTVQYSIRKVQVRQLLVGGCVPVSDAKVHQAPPGTHTVFGTHKALLPRHLY